MADIQILDDFLTPEDLISYTDYVKSKDNQAILVDENMAESFWNKYKEKLAPLGITSLENRITVSHLNHAVGIHKDERFGKETHKILIYLNDVENGGTVFFMRDRKEFVLENRKNRLVLFNLSLEHKGQYFKTKQTKYTIGFRAILASSGAS